MLECSNILKHSNKGKEGSEVQNGNTLHFGKQLQCDDKPASKQFVG